VVLWNAWMASASRCPSDEAMGQTLAQIFPGARFEALERAVDAVFNAGASSLLTHALHASPLPLKTRAGRQLLHDVVVSSGYSNADVVCVIQVLDVTESFRREKFLRERLNARYDALVESAPDVILNLDADGVIRLANPAAMSQFGYSQKELLGKDTSFLFESDKAWSDLWKGIRGGDAYASPVEVLVRLANGSLRYFEASAAQWRDGTRTFVTAILRDVNDRRDAEIALRESERMSRANAAALAQLNAVLKQSGEALNAMDRRKDEFLATLAHELRNPLAPLRNGLQLLKLAKDDPDLVARTRRMMELQLAQMVRLIDDLLDVSRISNDRIQLALESTSLGRIIRQAVETSAPLVDAQQHELTIEIPPDDVPLHADVVRLTQVFSNLLNNAAKYTPPNGVISIRAEEVGDTIVVRVHDSGIGIPREMLPKVFEMFVQIDNSLERAQGGLGIGLSLVKRLVEMHSGSVEAFSEGPGKGSEFVVRLPIARPRTNEQQRDREAAAARLHDTQTRRILVVDDNEDSATSLALLLSMLGHETETANDGLEAIEKAAEFKPDVALLDIGMPRLNGYDTARRIREAEWGKGMLLVALTGWGQESDRARSIASGFDAHLVKPVQATDIEQLLSESA
jgi:PAS domain S-box-containing protein